MEKSTIPEAARVLPSVWAMKRKNRVLDGSIYKWKARRKIDGVIQIQGVDYWEMYAPVASWNTIRIVLIIAIRNN
jgi:Reverse transcriptase (RNA-dependent DNA polymerase)